MPFSRAVDKPVEVQLPITPMLDMAFQLMFFFLATFNPSSIKEGQVDLVLAPAGEARAARPDQQDLHAPPRDERPDVATDVTVRVRGYRDVVNRGTVSCLSLTTLAGEEEVRGTAEERERLLGERLAGSRPANVRLTADRAVRWNEVLRVVDVCRKAGYRISFSQPPDLAFDE